MKKSKNSIEDELDEFYNGDTVTFLEVRFTDKMIQVAFPYKELSGFFRKLKGGSKKRVFMQILDNSTLSN